MEYLGIVYKYDSDLGSYLIQNCPIRFCEESDVVEYIDNLKEVE